MQSFTSKPVKSLTVQALQYEAPNAEGTGNLADVEQALTDAGCTVTRQSPWVPEGGQNSLIVSHSDGNDYPLHDGGYVVVYPKASDRSVELLDEDQFADLFEATAAPTPSHP